MSTRLKRTANHLYACRADVVVTYLAGREIVLVEGWIERLDESGLAIGLHGHGEIWVEWRDLRDIDVSRA